MLIFLTIVLIIFVLSETLAIIDSNKKVSEVCFEILKYSAVALFTICVCGIIKISSPQAIDVYRNKTALEITYKDSVPIDSVVVFKE